MGKTKKANVTITETKDIDENVVYVYNSKQSTNVPSLSPPCMALETYLRMIKVDYKKASNEKRVEKMHGDPKIMINRQEYVGLEKCMENLITQFKKDTEFLADCDLTDDQKADAEAYVKADVETVLFGALNAARAKKAQDAASENLMKRIKNQAQQLWKPKEMDDRSLSKLTFEDLSKKIKDSLSCLSNYLQRANNSKWFFGGAKPTKHDAIIFGLLAQFFYEPNEELNLKEFFEKDCHNVVDYLNHIKETYWSNWEQCCAPLPPPPPPPVVKEVEKAKESPAHNQELNGAQKIVEVTPNGATVDEDKKVEIIKADEPKIAPKAVEESPKTANTPEEKKFIIATPIVDVMVAPPVVVAVDTTTPSSEPIVEEAKFE